MPPIPDRRSPVTVCIAATCEDNGAPVIVACVDGKASSSLGSQEYAVKFRLINEWWTVLTAGSQDEINLILPSFRARFASPMIKDETTIVPLVQSVLRERRQQKREELVQNKYSMTYQDFLATGKERLPEDIYRADVYDISQICIDAEFIVIGFLDDHMPMLIHTDRFGNVRIMDHFATAGEGAFLAEASLLQREQYDFYPLWQTVYCVYEAKRISERVSSVGKETALVIMKQNGDIDLIKEVGRKFLGEQFLKFGPQDIDKAVIVPSEHIEAVLRDFKPIKAKETI